MAEETLNILCFGDSLTSGYHHYGTSSHPYSIAFKAKLQAALPHMTINVHHNGKPGDVGSWPAFNERLKNECDRRHYDWVIMLAGTNDLAYRVPTEDIYDAFQANWDVPLCKGNKVLALTIPESEAGLRWLVGDRAEVNRLILNHRERNFYAFDLHAKIPYHSLSEEDRAEYWDDGIHLTARGYDWMGEHIAEGFLAALSSAEQARATAPSQSRRPRKTADNAVFEEESGNPKKLSEGYVVVRKKDLY